MPIVDYTPNRFGDVSEMASRIPGPMNLAHRRFVDYYYTTRESSKLYLYYSDSGKLIGTLGRELAPFEYNSHRFTIRIASNWYSLQRGIGGELYQFSAQSNPDSTGLMFSGSQDTLSILRHHKWIFVPGIRGFHLNNPCNLYPGEARWRSAAKSFVRRAVRRKISSFESRVPSSVSARISVLEEHSYTTDLLPSRSPFLFRFAPDTEYLSWRYNLSLPFIRYRLFRIISGGTTIGYVVLSDSPEQIIVAQCDGEDATTLAYGVLLSILEVGREDPEPRTVFLACSHAEMEEVFRKFGLRDRWSNDLPFAFRTRPTELDLTQGSSRWLVNFDWGDNGVRPPFLDQRS